MGQKTPINCLRTDSIHTYINLHRISPALVEAECLDRYLLKYSEDINLPSILTWV